MFSNLIGADSLERLIANAEYGAEHQMRALITDFIRRRGCPCGRSAYEIICCRRVREPGHEIIISHGLDSTVCSFILPALKTLFAISVCGHEPVVKWSQEMTAATVIAEALRKKP